MIDVSTIAPVQIQRIGTEILVREMGTVGLLRFLQQFDLGHGNYTAERHQWLENVSMDDVLAQMQASEANN